MAVAAPAALLSALLRHSNAFKERAPRQKTPKQGTLDDHRKYVYIITTTLLFLPDLVPNAICCVADGGVVETCGEDPAEFSGVCLCNCRSESLMVVLSSENNMRKTGASTSASGLVNATKVPETLQA